MSEENETRIDVCPECKRNGDTSEKRLQQCRSCERWFCNKHLEPKMAFVRDLRHIEKDERIITMIEEESKKENGHPDSGYTLKRFEEIDKKFEDRSRLIDNALNVLSAYDKSVTVTTEKEQLRPISKEAEKARRTRIKPIIRGIVAAIWVVLIFGVIIWNVPNIIQTFHNIALPNTTPTRTYSHEELVNYALSLINSDRTHSGLSNVSLSLIGSGQAHADNMLTYDFFSHWDTKGYKPYMRYSLAGGHGSIAENIAWQYSSVSFDLKEALKDLEWQMVYNDSSSGWGHRDNILNPLRNKVGIGIAFDSHELYFVEDFENDYINWSSVNASQNGDVTMIGTLQRQFSLESVNIFHDYLPSSLTSEQLGKPPYSGSYGMGDFVGMALPSNYRSQEGITITAQTWVQTGQIFQIKFSLSQAFSLLGQGVYTLYLQPDPNSEDSLTNYSLWYYG